VNSLESEYMMLERPIMFAGLLNIRNRLGFKKFPLIDQSLYGAAGEMRFTPEYPIVVKVGHVHAGYGKMKLENSKQFDDLRSIVAMHNDYCTAEQFLQGDYDLRIQKIGDRCRVYTRHGISGGWKTNVGSALLEEIPITTEYKSWVDEAAKLFGGLDMFALDAIHTLDGKEYLLELNGSSIGLGPDREEDDNAIICDLVLRKLLSTVTEKTKNNSGEEVKESKKEIKNKVEELEVELLNIKNTNNRIEIELKEEKQKNLLLTQISRSKGKKSRRPIWIKTVLTLLGSFLVGFFIFSVVKTN